MAYKQDYFRTKNELDDISTYTFLIDNGGDVQELMIHLIADNKSEIVKGLYKKINQLGLSSIRIAKLKMTLLKAAIVGKNKDLIKYIIDDDICFKNNTDIINAAYESEQWDVVEYLIKKGAYSRQLLINSAIRGRLNFIMELSTSSLCSKHDLQNAICFASGNGHLEIVDFLIKKGVDVNTDNQKPIKWASYHCHQLVVDLLVANGANRKVGYDFAAKYEFKY